MTLHELITTKQQEAHEALRMSFKKAHNWHDFQDHCHNCGQTDAKKYPYCLPYEASKASNALILSTAHSVLDALKEDIRGNIQASCDCGREVCDKRGWNLALTEILSRLERFSSNEE